MSLEKALKSKKLKVTKARLAIAQTLERAQQPLRIESLYELLPEKPDLATVYRILENFEKAGLVHQVDLRHGHTHYEWGHAHHITCTKCHRIFPLDNEFEDLFKSIGKKYRKEIEITDHALEFFGICKECA